MRAYKHACIHTNTHTDKQGKHRVRVDTLALVEAHCEVVLRVRIAALGLAPVPRHLVSIVVRLLREPIRPARAASQLIRT